MSLDVSQLQTLQLILLAFFTVATTILAIATVMNTVRLRNVQQVWASGKLYGFPLFASIFLMFSIALTALVHMNGYSGQMAVMACYVWIGFSWFLASYAMMKRYITDYGIVKNINDPSQTVAWNDIVDYVEKNHEQGITYTFFYIVHDSETDEKKSLKLDLPVPDAELRLFKKILDRKLSRRFSTGSLPVYGLEQIRKDTE